MMRSPSELPQGAAGNIQATLASDLGDGPGRPRGGLAGFPLQAQSVKAPLSPLRGEGSGRGGPRGGSCAVEFIRSRITFAESKGLRRGCC